MGIYMMTFLGFFNLHPMRGDIVGNMAHDRLQIVYKTSHDWHSASSSSSSVAHQLEVETMLPTAPEHCL
jgi:hypothetical protein